MRQKSKTKKSRANRAWKPGAGGPKIESVRVLVLDDRDPDTSYLDQEGWEEQKRAYQRGDFSFVGVQAVAEIVIPTGAGMGYKQTIYSPGLWGIETISQRSYFKEIAKEEIAQLKDQLESIHANMRGFVSMSRDAIADVRVGVPDPPKTSRKKKNKAKR